MKKKVNLLYEPEKWKPLTTNITPCRAGYFSILLDLLLKVGCWTFLFCLLDKPIEKKLLEGLSYTSFMTRFLHGLPFLLFFLLAILVYIIFILQVINNIKRIKTSSFGFNDTHFRASLGSKENSYIVESFQRVLAVESRKTLLGLIFGYKSIHIRLKIGSLIKIKYIKNADEICAQLQELINSNQTTTYQVTK